MPDWDSQVMNATAIVFMTAMLVFTVWNYTYWRPRYRRKWEEFMGEKLTWKQIRKAEKELTEILSRRKRT
jgi:hypothetical protein